MILLSLLWLSLTAPSAGQTVPLQEPIELDAPFSVAEHWQSFAVSELPSTSPRARLLFDAEPPAGRARVDLLQRASGRWRWLSSAPLDAEGTAAIPEGERIGVLIRFERAPDVYSWADLDAGAPRSEIALNLVRNILLSPELREGTIVLFGDEPRSFTPDRDRVRFVPCERALFCVTLDSGDSCTILDARATVASLEPATGGVRVLHVEGGDAQWELFAKGTSFLRPKKIFATVARSDSWVAITLPPGTSWQDVVVDRRGQDALERLHGEHLAPLPGWSDPPPRLPKGLVIRPLIGKEKRPLSDEAAELYVFEEGDGPMASAIPMDSTVMKNGAFALPELASGSYVLKLFSFETTSEPVRMTATAGVPLDVVFPRGPVVRGRIVRLAGGSAEQPTTVEVIRQQETSAQAADPGDTMRIGTARSDGSFEISLGATGPYRLRARWGTALSEREFLVRDMIKDIDLGEISLSAGASLRGTFAGCAEGELRMTPLPDVSQPLTPSFFDYRRVRIQSDGSFLADGLAGGEWALAAKCGESVAVTPPIVVIPNQGMVLVDLQIAGQ